MFEASAIIKTAGLMGIFITIFSESGLLFGFFLPGDTLLFAAGIFASQGFFSITFLIIGATIAAIVGDSVGYWMGKNVGRNIFAHKSSPLLGISKNHIDRAERFYQSHGPVTIVIARFIPVIRTFAPILAGVAHMNYRKFLTYNIIGGVLWCVSLPLLGYYFGSLIPNPDRFLLPIVSLVMIVSFVPFIIRFIQHLVKKYRK
jgi:membrane-associated protein